MSSLRRVRRPDARSLLAALTLLAVAGCGGGDGTQPQARPTAPPTITVTTTALDEEGTFHARHTCDGEDISPALSWSPVPTGTASVALTLTDPDAPGGSFVHWLVAGIPPDVTQIDEGAAPAGAVEGENGFGATGYRGPCPPEGDEPHRYVFRIYALDRAPGLDPGFSVGDLDQAIDGHVVAWGELTGRYGR